MGDLITRRRVLLGIAASAIPAVMRAKMRAAQTAVQRVLDKFSLVDPGSLQLKGFLGERCRKNESAWLSAKDENELLDGFRNRPGKQSLVGEHIGKWLQAATLAYAYTKTLELKAKLERVAAGLIATQQADGYLGTYADGAHWGMGQGEKWDVRVHNYNLLGLVTYYSYTGNQPALDASKKIGDLLVKTFGRGTGGVAQLDLNERSTHVGMASGSVLEPMVLLYRATNDEKYLDFARFIVERWEDEKGPKLTSTLTREKSVKRAADAKAYEMMSCLVGLCELYRTTGELKYLTPAINAWNDIVTNQLLITGSGSSRERWTENKRYLYESKDEIAETCVTVTWMELTEQLLRLKGDARFADELEKSVYNHLAAAERPDGAAWTYFTALDGKKFYQTEQNCCTSSGPHGWGLVPAFAYMTSNDGIVVNFFTPGTARFKIKDETVVVKQETAYPLNGRVTLTVTVPKPMTFALHVRVPGWSNLNGIKSKPGEYWVLRQTWSKTQTVALDFSLPARVIKGEGASAGKVALVRGPQVLAVDQLYNPELRPLSAYALTSGEPQLKTSVTYRDPDGLPVYETEAVALENTEKHKAGERVMLRLIPFASAGAYGHEFVVWLRPPNPNPLSTGVQQNQG